MDLPLIDLHIFYPATRWLFILSTYLGVVVLRRRG